MFLYVLITQRGPCCFSLYFRGHATGLRRRLVSVACFFQDMAGRGGRGGGYHPSSKVDELCGRMDAALSMVQTENNGNEIASVVPRINNRVSRDSIHCLYPKDEK